MEEYIRQKDYLIAGVPIPSATALTVRQLCNRFLHLKESRRETGEISERTYTELLSTCKHLASHFGDRAVFTLQPLDFERYRGKPLVTETRNEGRIDAVANRFANLKSRLKYNRESSGFKNFRHTYRTVVDEAGDQPAILLTMGHADSGISDYYRHGIADERLVKVSQFVRNWLFGAAKQGN